MIEIAAIARVFRTPLFRSAFSIPIMLALLVIGAGAQNHNDERYGRHDSAWNRSRLTGRILCSERFRQYQSLQR